VDPVGAPDRRGGAELVRPRRDHLFEPGGGGEEEVESPGELEGEGGVDDVGRREPVVDPRPLGLADAGLHHVDEGGHVVLGYALALLDRGDVEAGPLPHEPGGLGRYDPEPGPRLHGQDLDLEPGAEARLVGEEGSHLGDV